MMVLRRRTRKGTSLDADDRMHVLGWKPEGEKAEEWLAHHRFQTTQFGKVDRRCNGPVAINDERPLTQRRQQLGQIRALARAIVIELKRSRELTTK